MKIELSNTIKNIPENVFYPIFKLISEESSNGNPLLNAGIGVPDSDTPELLLKELETAIRKPENMRYGAFDGKVTLLNEISQWLKENYNIDADPKSEIALVFGTKSGLSSIPSVLLNPNDTVLLPVPSYPDYIQGIALAQAKYEEIELKQENNYLLDYSDIPEEVLRDAKLIFLNYPSNPIGAVATKEFYEQTVKWAKENNIPLIRLSESEYQSVVKLTQFLKDELIPSLPDEAFYQENSKPQFVWSGFRNRSVNISSLVKEQYSIKEVAELMGYSESYVGSRIKSSHWFTNESGKSNLDVPPYSINLEDVISGLVRLGFLKDFDGEKISGVDKSMIIELVEKLNHKKKKDSGTLLIIQWDPDFIPDVIDTTEINKVILKRNPNFREAVLIAMKDEIGKIIFWGEAPEELRELVDHSIIKEKLIEVLK